MAGPTLQRSEHSLDAVGVSLGLTILGFLVGSLAATVIGSLLAAIGIPITDPVPRTVLSALMLQGIGFGSVALIYLVRTDRTLVSVRKPTWRDLGLTIGGILGLFIALVAGNLLVSALGADAGRHELVLTGAENPGVLLVLIPLSFVLIGPAEELLFRGIVQGLLVKRFGATLGIGIASLIFALVHAGALVTSGLIALASSMTIYLLLSLILGAIYEYSRNILVPALVHGTFNAVQFAVLYYTITNGGTIVPTITGLG